MTPIKDLRGRTAQLALALDAMAKENGAAQRRYIEMHGCPADGECPKHGRLAWERHISRIALEAAGIEFTT